MNMEEDGGDIGVVLISSRTVNDAGDDSIEEVVSLYILILDLEHHSP